METISKEAAEQLRNEWNAKFGVFFALNPGNDEFKKRYVEFLDKLNCMTEPEPERPKPKVEIGQWMKFIDRNVIKKCVLTEWNLHWKGNYRYYIDEVEYWRDCQIIPVVSLQLPDEPIRVGSWVITEDGITGLLIGINPDVHRKYIVSCDHKGNCTNDWRVTTAARVPDWAKGGK